MNRGIPAFTADERGGISVFILTLFVGLLMISGVAIDLLRHEAERADMQAALDRGVLAAASIRQTLDSKTVVDSYMGIGMPNAKDLVTDVTATNGVGSRRIDAAALHSINTTFLGFVGYRQFNLAIGAAAAEGLTDVEISLVLDISGTMRWDNRLPNLRIAANAFIDTVTQNGASPTTTISIVPYAGQVNPGPFLFNLLGGVRNHAYSSCFEFTSADFANGQLPSTGTYAQVPNFHHWAIDWAWMDWGWCPSDNTAISYISNDATLLKQKIDNIRLHDGTGTYNAMKWGLALLDPTTQPTVLAMSVAGLVSPDYADRPKAWDDPNTIKFIVLMTDGQITQQYRPDNPNDPDLATEEVRVYGHPYSQTLSRDSGVGYFYALCNAAKDNGVVVFTIAFEAPSNARTEMRNCASSPSHFYDVQGLQIADAFSQIAATIQKLKLVR